MATHNKIFTGEMGVVWVQPDGPNTPCYLLACSDVGDLGDPQGESMVTYCRDFRRGGWKVVSRRKGLPDQPSLPITVLLGPTATWLEKNKACPMPVYVNQRLCGRADTFLNFDRAIVFQYGSITAITEANLALRAATDESTQAYDITGERVERAYQPHLEQMTTSGEPNGLNDVIFVDTPRCMGACGPAIKGGQHGFMVADSVALGAPANVWETTDGGVTWAAVTAPYATLDNIMSITAFSWGGGKRLVVVRDDLSGGGGPLDTMYSDDYGVTWVESTAGAVAGEAAQYNGALFALDAHHVWLVTDTPNIYMSKDGGLTWDAQAHSATNPLNYVRFIDELYGIAVGENSEIQVTVNGGELWQDAAGLPSGKGAVAINCCEILGPNRMWVGYDDGTLFYTEDGGATWTERAYSLPPGSIVGSTIAVTDSMFLDDYCGYMTVKWQSSGPISEGVVYRTINGGHDWQYYAPTSSMAGFWNAVWAVDYDTAFMAGEVTAVGPISHRLLV